LSRGGAALRAGAAGHTQSCKQRKQPPPRAARAAARRRRRGPRYARSLAATLLHLLLLLPMRAAALGSEGKMRLFFTLLDLCLCTVHRMDRRRGRRATAKGHRSNCLSSLGGRAGRRAC
jgi:hypothetical protein